VTHGLSSRPARGNLSHDAIRQIFVTDTVTLGAPWDREERARRGRVAPQIRQGAEADRWNEDGEGEPPATDSSTRSDNIPLTCRRSEPELQSGFCNRTHAKITMHLYCIH
jgi:hypothetical protein